MSDARWMRRCIELAEQARARTTPNPMVGALIVRDGVALAEGWHRQAGLAHAEVDALDMLPEDAGDLSTATMYVNLEPCCHHGRTPPCTDALLAAGIGKVVVGMVDPDDRVSGRGIAILRDAGVEVAVGVEEQACRRLNAPYLSARERGRPQVTLKAAVSLDGRIADAFGRSQWITGPEARLAGHRLRDSHDAVLVGSGTLLADDPGLNTRFDGGHDALPVVLDSGLRCPADAAVLRAGRRPVLFCGTDAPTRDLPADIERVPRGPGGLDLAAVMAALVGRNIHSVLVEGGGRVHRSLLDAGMVDRIELFVAARVLAGGPGWVAGEPFRLAEAPAFRVSGTRRVGDDLQVSLER